MPWKEVSKMSQKQEFIHLVKQGCSTFKDLCKRFKISTPTGYKWLNRYNEYGDKGLEEKSSRPKTSPMKTRDNIEQLIIKERDAHPVWGGRKLYRILKNKGYKNIPHPSTITDILRRNHRISKEESKKHESFKRFEHKEPNELWQMDFKGHFSLEHGRCHPLTILDDHSRYALCLKACTGETTNIVKRAMIETFERYGLPNRITMDNGSPWGNARYSERYSSFDIWLIRQGIRVSHSSVRHPQTQGKDERFHRTLKEEILNLVSLHNQEDAQKKFDAWRIVYNYERPHEALSMEPPITRYKPSTRIYTGKLQEIEYLSDDIIRKVDISGKISYKGKEIKVGVVFSKNYVAIRPTNKDGKYNIFFCQQIIKKLNFKEQKGT
jgi:transposase InsO family protein